MSWLRRRVPATAWLRNYRRHDLRGDVNAGLTVAVMLVPQAMAYALLAGLPPVVGLYAATVPLIAYAVLGTSRQLAVGPAAMDSLLVAIAVGKRATPGSPEYIAHAVLLAVLVGSTQVAMGILRLGWLVRLLSHPVVIGFTTAAALIIGFSQLGGLLGIDLPRTHHIHLILRAAVLQISESNVPTLIIGCTSTAVLITLHRLRPRFPAALAIVVLATLAVHAFSLERFGVRIVGQVPPGLPRLAVPQLSGTALVGLSPAALMLALVGFIEAIAIGKTMAARHGYTIEADQELIALGAANLAAGLFGGYPVTGGFSRTAIADQAGARSGLASTIAAATVSIALLFLTGLFYQLPIAALSAMIVVAVASLATPHEFRRLWQIKRSDALLAGLTLGATLALDINLGILVGVGASLLLFIVRTTRPHTAILGRLPGSPGVYRNIKRFANAETIPGLVILRVDAAFYFANTDFFRARLARIERETSTPPAGVIIDASSINDLDTSAALALREIVRDYEQRDVSLYLASVKGPVRDVLQRTGIASQLGTDRLTLSIDEAVQNFHRSRDTAQSSTPNEVSR